MEALIQDLGILKYASVPQELSGSDGKVHTRILISSTTTSVFIERDNYYGTIHFCSDKGYEHLTIHKNRGRWTPKQRQILQNLGFTIEAEYATRRNAP